MQLLWLGVGEKPVEYKQLIELDKRGQPKVYFAYSGEIYSRICPLTDAPFPDERVKFLFQLRHIFSNLFYLL